MSLAHKLISSPDMVAAEEERLNDIKGHEKKKAPKHKEQSKHE